MKLEPILTEKSLKLASGGRYSFRVARTLNKRQIKSRQNKAKYIKR